MQTKDPHLTKTPIAPTQDIAQDIAAADANAHTTAVGENTQVNKGTQTLTADMVDSEHVNSGDNPARQPDRRDQQGSAFDEGINETTAPRFGQDEPKSDEITDHNRYATIDNGQKRVLNPSERD